MTHRELLYIKTIAEEKSISKAAAKLFLSQPSLSQCIGRIESELGTKLFKRSATGLSTTYAGERYLNMAHQVLRLYKDFEAEISDINNLNIGRLDIGITTHLASALLPKLLPRYRALYPNLSICITEESSSVLEEMVLSGKVDFAVMHTHPLLISQYSHALRYSMIQNDPFVLVAPTDSPLQGSSSPIAPYPIINSALLNSQEFIMVSPGRRIRQVTDIILSKAGITPKITLTTQSFETAKRLASVGMGVTLLPQAYLSIFAGEFATQLFSLPAQWEGQWALSIAMQKDGYVSGASREFIRLLTDYSTPPSLGSCSNAPAPTPY